MLRGGIGDDYAQEPLFPKTVTQIAKERRRMRLEEVVQLRFELNAEIAIMKEKARALMLTLETQFDTGKRPHHEDPQWPRYVKKN